MTAMTVKQIGSHRLLCGDITTEDLSVLMDGEKADIIYSDPPWNAGMATLFRKWAGKPAKVDLDEFFNALLLNLKTHGKGVVVLDVGVQSYARFKKCAEAAGAKMIDEIEMEWDSGGKYHTWVGTFNESPIDWYDIDKAKYQNIEDSVEALEYLLSGWPAGDGIFLDPCIGYGLGAKVGARLGLSVYGMELNPKRLAKTEAFLNAM